MQINSFKERLRHCILVYAFCIDVIVKGMASFLLSSGFTSTSIITRLLYGLLVLLLVLFYFISKTFVFRGKEVLLWFLLIAAFLESFLLFPTNREVIVKVLQQQAIFPFIVFFVFLQLGIGADLQWIFKTSSYVYFIFSCMILIFTDSNLFRYSWYMIFGYFMIIPAIFFLHFYQLEEKVLYLLLSFVSIMLVMVYGNRGAVLCYLGYIFISVILKKHVIKKLLSIAGIVILGVVVLNNISFLTSFFGIEFSRNFSSLIMGKFFSMDSRMNSYRLVIDAIKDNWLMGRGLFSDRVIISGGELNTYAHSIFLEILLAFGVPIGGGLLLFLGVKSVDLLVKQEKTLNMFLPLFSSVFFRLLLSDSFIVTINFYVLVALFFYASYETNDKKRRSGYCEKGNNNI